jgi:two-component system phosphate regulon sensor histidine kinase PhoR
MNFSLKSAEVKYALIALILGSVGGVLTGYWVISVSLALIAFICWLLLQISQLQAWLDADAPVDNAPYLSGSADNFVLKVCDIKKHNRKQQENLEELIRRFDAATSAMPDAMLIVDKQQNLEWANPAAQRLLGIGDLRDIGHRIDNIVRDPAITSYLLNQDYAEPLEFSSAESNQNDLVLRVIPYGDGRRLLCVHDHQDQLRLQQVRQAFIANASHEMRTPLTVIIGYLEVLTAREEGIDEITRRGVEGSLDQAYRMKQLIEDLLSLSKLESSPLAKSKEVDSNLATLTRQCIETLESSSNEHLQKIHLSVVDDVSVRGDDQELISAIQNIIENAVKYSSSGTRIEIEIIQTTQGLGKISVVDDGDGIAAEHLSRLAERFYRVDKGRSRDKGGTGLGLSIVKHIMDRHSGELRINSAVGQGTKVELIFPANRTKVISEAVASNS